MKKIDYSDGNVPPPHIFDITIIPPCLTDDAQSRFKRIITGEVGYLLLNFGGLKQLFFCQLKHNFSGSLNVDKPQKFVTRQLSGVFFKHSKTLFNLAWIDLCNDSSFCSSSVGVFVKSGTFSSL